MTVAAAGPSHAIKGAGRAESFRATRGRGSSAASRGSTKPAVSARALPQSVLQASSSEATATGAPGVSSTKGHRSGRKSGDQLEPLQPVASLEATAAEFEKRQAEEEAKLDATKAPLPVRVGRELVAKKVNVKELVATWARRGEEPINKMEFRQHVRKLVKCEVSVPRMMKSWRWIWDLAIVSADKLRLAGFAKLDVSYAMRNAL